MEKVQSGVSQGSILRTLLFLSYVNDLPLYLHETISELYADDTTIHTSTEYVHIINNKLQNDLVRSLSKSDTKAFWNTLHKYSTNKKDNPDIDLENFFEYLKKLNAGEYAWGRTYLDGEGVILVGDQLTLPLNL